jgi:ribosomal protein S18 acetylase RimI-like enzyme
MTVRRLRRDEAELLRDVRLRALRDSPWAFESSHARELGHTAERGQRFADQVDSVIYVAMEGHACVGMAGGFTPPDLDDTVQLWGMWVAPDARGRGRGRALVEAVLAWAGERGAGTVRLDVTDTAPARPAAALYRAIGFEPTGERNVLDSDPSLETLVMTRSP